MVWGWVKHLCKLSLLRKQNAKKIYIYFLYFYILHLLMFHQNKVHFESDIKVATSMNNSRSVPKDSWRCSRSVNLTERQADHSVPAFFLKSQPYTWNNGFPQAKYHPLIIANMEIWGSKCATYHHHLEVLFYFHSLSSLHLFLLFYHQPSDCSQKPKLFPWFNDPHPWRVCSAEPGTGMCLNSVFDGISQFETRTEWTLSDTLETQHLRFLLRRFCCCCCYCKTFTFAF